MVRPRGRPIAVDHCDKLALPVRVPLGPIAATGIANIWEVCQHVRNEGGPRQIEGAKIGLAQIEPRTIGSLADRHVSGAVPLTL
jgi:hypothetical protein